MRDSVAILGAALGVGAAVAALIVGIVGVADLAISSSPYEQEMEARNKHVEELYGDVDWDDLTGDQQWEVYQQPGMAELYRKTLEDRAGRTGKVAQRATAQIDYLDKVDQLNAWVEQGWKVTPGGKKEAYRYTDWREDIEEARTQHGRLLDFIGDRGTGNEVMDGYYDLTEQARDASGIDFEHLDDLRADYIEQHPEVEKELDKRGLHDTPLERQYREAEKLNDEYREIPIYQYMTPEQSRFAYEQDRQIDQWISAGVVKETGALSARQMGYLRLHADVEERLGEEAADEAVAAAMAANKAKWNPEREEFRQNNEDNKLFQLFWYNADDRHLRDEEEGEREE